MQTSLIQSLLNGVFCACVAILGTSAHAQVLGVKDVDRLERELRRAYDSTDPADFPVFEEIFPKLKLHYQLSGKLQELAWLNHAYGFEEEAARIERQIEQTLRTAPIRTLTRLDENNGRVLLTRWPGGLQGLIITRERRLGLSSADPTLTALTDKRRHAIVAYNINRIMGLRLVPVTTTRQSGDRLELVRAYIADAKPYDKDHRKEAYDHEELHVLDYTMEQIDRNDIGLLVRPGGEIVAIDNKHSLSVGRLGLIAREMQPALTPPKTISKDLRAAVLRLAKVLDRNTIEDIPGATAEDFREMRGRVTILLELPVASFVPAPCTRNLTN